MAYIKKEPIVEFITKGLNNPDKTKAFGYDAIEILTEIEFSPTADVVPKSEVAREIFKDINFEIHQLMFVPDEQYGYRIKEVLGALEKKYTEGSE